MRRFFRFRVSTLLIAIACCAVAFAWWKDRQDSRRSQAAIEDRLQWQIRAAELWREACREGAQLHAAESLAAVEQPSRDRTRKLADEFEKLYADSSISGPHRSAEDQ